MENKIVQHGYIEPVVKSEDYRFGSGDVSLYYPIQLDSDWTSFLTQDEDQNLRNIETYNCTAFAITNQIETFMKNKFGLDTNYSDRFLGLVAGTKPPGNDPNKVYEAVRKFGLVPEEMCPFSDDLMGADEYFSWKGCDKEACLKAGRDWLSKYLFLHDWVADGTPTTTDVMKTALQYSPLCGAVYAWAFDGVKYIRIGGDTHWTMFFKIDDFVEDFDSYDPNRKNLDLNFGFTFVKRIHIEPADIIQKKQTWIIQQIIALYQKIVEILSLSKSAPETPEIPKVENIPAPSPIVQPVAEIPIKPPIVEVKVSRITDWAKAIAEMENANPNWNNPGAIRGVDGKFLRFDHYQDGFDYLCSYLTRACTGKHKAYPKGGETTLEEFQQIYSPPSENQTLIYANYIAKKLNISLETKIGTLL